MSKASRCKHDKYQSNMGLSAAQVQTIPGHSKTAANDEWCDDVATATDEILMEKLTIAVARDDAQAVVNVLPLLSQQQISMGAISFRDTNTGRVYSILGLAKHFQSWDVFLLMNSLGMTQEFGDVEGIFN